MKIETFLHRCQRRVTNILNKKLLPAPKQKPRELHQAMRYAVLNGGKRIRAALIYATGEALGADIKILDRVSATVEMMHAFSLVHDDLPALDNDDLRRGKPSCHKVFGEATAILAGDALQTLAVEILSTLDQKKVKPIVVLEMIKVLSHAILEMERGEILDILMEGKKVTLKELTDTYALKTGCLLTASVLLGALSANCQDKKILQNLKKFGDYMGLAFQIHDDIIGVESDTKVLGKPKGSDELRQKPTFPSMLGLAKAKQKERAAYLKAMQYLNKSGIDKKKLTDIAAYVIERNF